VGQPALAKLVSGGQTGVDRAALDVALRLGIPCGGWCPRGRRAEDGTIPPRYPLVETPQARYPQRTEWNVRDSDGTLVIHAGPPRGGTALTARLARRRDKPVLCVDLDAHPQAGTITEWIAAHAIAVLNVAGPRESESHGIGGRAAGLLAAALDPGLQTLRR
jgi:predicted Rossmann fold nucleotide-binding protein DprA/Smf involved in DNA uptake